MYVNVKNENYGYAVSTYGWFVTVGNPGIVRYNPATSSKTWSGSVDVFLYNKATDQHDYVDTLYNRIDPEVLLFAETGSPIPMLLVPPYITGSLYSASLHTEVSGSVYTRDKDIQINLGSYKRMLEDGYGLSLDTNRKTLVVGSPYYLLTIGLSSITYSFSGSNVDIYDLTKYEHNNSNVNSTGSSDPYILSINNPDTPFSGSFGLAVSINDGWIAVGSPYHNNNEGAVYLYKNESVGNNLSWSFQQKLTPPISSPGLLFGHSIELNKATGSVSGSLIIGTGNISSSKAYLFEFSNSLWRNTYTFGPNGASNILTFGGYQAYSSSFRSDNGYGTAVSLYNNTVVIGSRTDRIVSEYSSSYLYEQGSVYVYEKCIGVSPLTYNLVLKTYGNENTIKNNRLGYSVGIYGNNIVAGCPKINLDSISSCFIEATLNQLHYCSPNLETSLNGQILFIQRNTSSYDWELTNVYQKKKRYLSPYRVFGESVDIADFSMVVGAPMLLNDIGRQINLITTQSADTLIDDLAGKAYIYDLHHFRDKFHVGNVFYRDGKMILMTSGSVFDGIMFSPASKYSYEYELDFKSRHTINEKQIVCTVNPGEFNVSTNPSAITREVPIFDINGNGYFDFQDVDVLLSYMQYKNTQIYNKGAITTNWSSSIVTLDSEKSLLSYYQSSYDTTHTDALISESIVNFDMVNTSMQANLDFNQDNKIDTNDLNILWKYFVSGLTPENYSTYITPACRRQLYSDIVDHMNDLTKKSSLPMIRGEFFGYENSVAVDKTGSYLAPMATCIGLYSGLDLVAVAKLGSPIKITPEFPINFVVKMDF